MDTFRSFDTVAFANSKAAVISIYEASVNEPMQNAIIGRWTRCATCNNVWHAYFNGVRAISHRSIGSTKVVLSVMETSQDSSYVILSILWGPTYNKLNLLRNQVFNNCPMSSYYVDFY